MNTFPSCTLSVLKNTKQNSLKLDILHCARGVPPKKSELIVTLSIEVVFPNLTILIQYKNCLYAIKWTKLDLLILMKLFLFGDYKSNLWLYIHVHLLWSKHAVYFYNHIFTVFNHLEVCFNQLMTRDYTTNCQHVETLNQ